MIWAGFQAEDFFVFILFLCSYISLVALNEPHAMEKRRIFIEKKGTMGPAVFLTPREMTLSYLDRQIGNAEDVARFYGL